MCADVVFWRGHWQLILLTALIVMLWQTALIVPLKLLIVFLHELSHVLATILTGGKVQSLSIDPLEGGSVVSLGGNRFVTLSAGYVGSLLIGVGLLVCAIRTRLDKAALACLAATLLGVTVIYARDAFALGFGVLTGVMLLLVVRFTRREASDLILRVVGVTSMIYVPLDIFSDTIARSNLRSDARMLAEEFAGPTVFWGGLWLLISLVVIGWSLRHILGAQSNVRFGS